MKSDKIKKRGFKKIGLELIFPLKNNFTLHKKRT